MASEKCWALSSVKELFGVGATTFDEELGPSAKRGWCLVEGRRRWVVAKPRFLAVYDASDADKDAARFVELECSSHKVVVEGCDVSVGNLKVTDRGPRPR